MAKIDRSILSANDQSMGQFGDPDKIESSISHVADIVDQNDNGFNAHKDAEELAHPDKSVTEKKLADGAANGRVIAPGAVGIPQLDPEIFNQPNTGFGFQAKFQEVDDHATGWENAKSFTTLLNALNVLSNKKLLIPPGDYYLDQDVDLVLENFQIEGQGLVNIYLTVPGQTIKLDIKHCDICNVYFIGLGKTSGQTVHLSTYRMNMFNCRFRYIQEIKTNSVYNFLDTVHFLDNGSAFVPINLEGELPWSTMFRLEKCVFFGNDIGIHLGKGINECPIRFSLIHCGFEQNNIGIQQDKMLRFGEIQGCWFEQNITYHANLYSYGWKLDTYRLNNEPEKFVLRPFEASTVPDGQGGYTDITQYTISTNELELQNILGSRSLVKGRGKIKLNSIDHINGSFKRIPSAKYNYVSDDSTVNVSKSLVYTEGQEYNARATIFVDSDGTLKKSSFHLPLTVVKIDVGKYKVTWDAAKYLMYPHIKVSSYTRAVYPSYFKTEFAVTLTTNHADWNDYGKMNEIYVYTFDSSGVLIDNKFSIDMAYTIENI